jgi:hypothetical protein
VTGSQRALILMYLLDGYDENIDGESAKLENTSARVVFRDKVFAVASIKVWNRLLAEKWLY